jgi:MYXO-CTERM domain-containing protein
VVAEGHGIFCATTTRPSEDGSPWLAGAAMAALAVFRRRRSRVADSARS